MNHKPLTSHSMPELPMIFMSVYSWTKILMNLPICMKSSLEDGEIHNLSLEEVNKELIKLLLPLTESVVMILI